MKPHKYLWRRLNASRHRRMALSQLRELERKLPSPAARFAVPFVFRGRGHFRKIEARQNPTEIEVLYRLVCELRPRRVLEIGTARGGTLYLWAQAAADGATILSVDLPGGAFGGAYAECRAPFYQAFARPGQTICLLRADSHDPSTLGEVRRRLNGELLDFLFIDGDHSYEGVKRDFEEYGPLVRPGGLMAFHDIVPREFGSPIQVDRLWSQLRDGYRGREIIGPPTSRPIGIGLITVAPSGTVA